MHFHSKKKKKRKKKQKKKRQKKNKKKQKKKKSAKICLCLISYSIDFFVGSISGGLSEIFMRDELRESSLRSFVPCSSND